MPLRKIPTALMIVLLAISGCARLGAMHRASPSPGVPGADLKRGKAVYLVQCAACHGIAGMGGEIGPSLTNERARRSYKAVRAFITDPLPPMPKLYPSRMTQSEVRDVSAYVESL